MKAWVRTRAGLEPGLVWLCQGIRPYVALVLVCLTLWLPGFTQLPTGDRDEARFVQATRQMLDSGDFVDIRNGLVPRYRKPIGIYWLQVPFAAAARELGIARRNPVWPYRIPSLLGGIVAVLAVFGFGQRLVGARAALAGAVFLAGSLVLCVEVHIAKTDAALLGASTVMMGVLAEAWLRPTELSRLKAALFWATLALTVLLKGPVAPMVAGLTLLALALSGKRAEVVTCLRALHPGFGVVLFLALVLPWFVAIDISTHGEFFARAIGRDLTNKLVGGDDAHGAPPGLHLALATMLLFAATAPAVAAIPYAWELRRRAEMRFLLAWLVPSWLVFEIVPTKLPHYTLPLYPALCLLAGWMMASALTPSRRLGWVGSGLALVAALGLGGAAMALPYVVAPGNAALDGLGWPAGVTALVLAVALVGLGWARPRRTAGLMLLALPALLVSILGYELPRLRPIWITPRVAADLRAHWPQGRPADAAFASLGFAEPSLIFLCGTDTLLLGTTDLATRFLMPDGAHVAPDRVVAVTARYWDALATRLATRGASLHPFAEVDGFNISNGKRVRLLMATATSR